MLTPLQERVAEIISALAEADGFALAGGAALVLEGTVDRTTRDLDFFATEPDAVARLLPAAERALGQAGLTVERDRISEGFARLLVADGSAETVVDLGYDYRSRPARPSRLGPMLASEDLAASKMLALFGRAEARDFIDVAALAARHGFNALCDLARDHDPGFNLAALADALRYFQWIPQLDFDLADDQYAQLRGTVEGWLAQAEGPQGLPT